VTAPRVRLSTDEFRYLALFERIAKVRPVDCVTHPEGEIIFLVSSDEYPLVTLNPTKPIARLSRMLNARVLVYPFCDNTEDFVVNLFRQVKVDSVSFVDAKDGRRIANVKVAEVDKGKAIGQGGANVRRASLLIKRYFEIDQVKIV